MLPSGTVATNATSVDAIQTAAGTCIWTGDAERGKTAPITSVVFSTLILALWEMLHI
jgi:hypothetical protein